MKYKVRKGARWVTVSPKKSKKADLRRWSPVFFFLGLNLVLIALYYAFSYTTYEYLGEENSSSASVQPVHTSDDSSSAEEKILSINPEQIENIVNTEAVTHAVWPGYKGSITDGPKVRKHFADNLARIIINGGGVNVDREYRVHFYYVVRDDGAIQFLSLVGNGVTTPNVPRFVIKKAQSIVNIGVPGIKPGTDVNGEPITVVYELVIRFKPGG